MPPKSLQRRLLNRALRPRVANGSGERNVPTDDKKNDNRKSDLTRLSKSDDLVGRPLTRLERSGQPLDPSITEQQVSDLVEHFYAQVRQNPRLSGLFDAGMSLQWPDHLDRMKAFWRSMLMQTREYGGRPVPAHMKMTDLQPEDFALWLDLFRQSARTICPPTAAALYIDRAQTVARSLQMAVFLSGRIAPPDAFKDGVMSAEFIAQIRQQANDKRTDAPD